MLFDGWLGPTAGHRMSFVDPARQDRSVFETSMLGHVMTISCLRKTQVVRHIWIAALALAAVSRPGARLRRVARDRRELAEHRRGLHGQVRRTPPGSARRAARSQPLPDPLAPAPISPVPAPAARTRSRALQRRTPAPRRRSPCSISASTQRCAPRSAGGRPGTPGRSRSPPRRCRSGTSSPRRSAPSTSGSGRHRRANAIILSMLLPKRIHGCAPTASEHTAVSSVSGGGVSQ